MENVEDFSWNFLRPFSLEIEGRKTAKNFAKISPHFSPISSKIFARTSLWGIAGTSRSHKTKTQEFLTDKKVGRNNTQVYGKMRGVPARWGDPARGIPTLLDTVLAEEYHEPGPLSPFEPGPPFRPGPLPPFCTSLGRVRGKGSRLERGSQKVAFSNCGRFGRGNTTSRVPPTSRDPLPILSISSNAWLADPACKPGSSRQRVREKQRGGWKIRMRLFAYSWKLPAYSGAFLLTVDNFSFLTYSWSFSAYSFGFFTYSSSFFAYSGKVRLIRALRDCKQRSLTVRKKASTVSKKASPGWKTQGRGKHTIKP